MKKYLLSFILLSSIVVITTSCKKKKNDPTPSSPPSVGVSFNWNGTRVPFNSINYYTAVDYYQVAFDSTTSHSLTVKFLNGKPTASLIYPLDVQDPLVYVYYTDPNGKFWYAFMGSVTVTVNQGFVTSTFSNLAFQTTPLAIIAVNNCSITTK